MTIINQTKYPQRVRNELRFRELTVLRVERIGQAFQRIVLGARRWMALFHKVLTTTPNCFSRRRAAYSRRRK